MNIGKPRELGKTIEDIEERDSLPLTESTEDKDLLLYLGLTNDANPSYIQHDYTQKTECEKPAVPSIMLMGTIASAVSKRSPGSGSHVVNFSVNLAELALHYETLISQLEVIRVDRMKDVVIVSVEAVDEQENRMLDVVVVVQSPQVTIDELTEEEGTLTCE